MKDYWVPEFKWQLVDWMIKHFTNCGDKRQWKYMSKKQLYAIYFEERDKNG